VTNLVFRVSSFLFYPNVYTHPW